MDAPDPSSSNETLTTAVVPKPELPSKRSLATIPLSTLIDHLLEQGDRMKSFLSLTGPTLLYSLSALSIVYGITRMIGPPLATSYRIGDILPSLAILNAYEIALLGVVVLLVVWRHITDDAIPLVILIALFLVASGMTLGVIAPSGLNLCLFLGVTSVLLGAIKILLLRTHIGLPISPLTFMGIMIILMWNFLGSSLMARPLMAQAAPDELRRQHWLVSWLILLVAAIFVLVDATRKAYSDSPTKKNRPPYIHTSGMIWLFVLVLLGAIGFHQYGVAHMFAVDYTARDFMPLLLVITLLVLEFVRSQRWKNGNVVVAVTCIPLGIALFISFQQPASVSRISGLELLCCPPLVLGLTGLALFGLRLRHQWPALHFVAVFYGLGVLLTLTASNRPNWPLFGIGLISLLFLWGLVRKNPKLCLAGVLILAMGLGQSDALLQWTQRQDVTHIGLIAGIIGLGIFLIALVFGRHTPRKMTLIGSIMLGLCIFDLHPKTITWIDLVLTIVIMLCFLTLWKRTQDVVVPLTLWVPELPRLYLLSTAMSSWSFIVLSFLLLATGTGISLFLKPPPRHNLDL